MQASLSFVDSPGGDFDAFAHFLSADAAERMRGEAGLFVDIGRRRR
ncbi:hypothetical protein [Modicisalibacter radicis]|nr:hypothetical protein [Halomonas sp. EAR18]